MAVLLLGTATHAWAGGNVSDYKKPLVIATVSPMAKQVQKPVIPDEADLSSRRKSGSPALPETLGDSGVRQNDNISMGSQTPVVSRDTLPTVSAKTTQGMTSMVAPSSDPNPLPVPDFNGEQPMNVSANEMIYEQKLDKVTANGKVVIVQEGRKLEAEKVIYHIKEDKAFAQGNVILTDTNGDVHRAESIEMKDAFKEGFVKSLSSILSDGSRITAREGQRIDAKKIILKDAWYTPCKGCESNPDETPDWNVVAEQVTLDSENHRVVYKNARFELFGVPVFYTPYLSHSDGTIKQKSGILPPKYGYSSQIGAFLDTRYYYALAPDRDATVGAIVTGRGGTLGTAEYRRRYDDAELSLAGTAVNSTRPLDNDERSNKELRGSLNGKGLWDINNKWRAGYKLNVVSDEQYLRQYKLPNEDVLENKLYLERFDERNYAGVRALAFQDTRISRANIDQPYVLPLVEVEHYSEPKAVLGGRTKLTGSTVGLIREGSGQDLQRFSAQGEWNKRAILPGGVVSDTDLTARGDLYAVQQRFTASDTPGQGSADTISRRYIQANTKLGYPLAKRVEEGSIVLEPQAAFAVSSDVRNLNDIPNEDSTDVDFSIAQLFAPSRFAGYDRVDDGTRATVGLSTQYIADAGQQAEVFFGQSYRLSNDTNPFPDGSGLENRKSDLVGRVRYTGAGGSNIEYGARFANKTLAANRHDIVANLIGDPISVSATYFYLAPLQGTDLTESQEQFAVSPYLKISDQWRLRNTLRYDLSGDQNEQGLQTASIGLDYIGDCINLSIEASRNNLDEASGTSENEIFFRLGFKNLGEIETSPITFGQQRDDISTN